MQIVYNAQRCHYLPVQSVHHLLIVLVCIHIGINLFVEQSLAIELREISELNNLCSVLDLLCIFALHDEAQTLNILRQRTIRILLIESLKVFPPL